MSENPGGTPPRDDDPSVPPPPPAYGQPSAGEPAPPGAPIPPPGAPTPPPGGAYPPPPAYGTPGGAGAYPPPASPYGAQAPGYGAPTPGVGIGEAFNWGWSKFQQNVGTILLAMLAWLVGLAVVVGIWYAVLGAIGLGFAGTTDEYGNPTGATTVFSGAFFLAFVLFGVVAFLALFVFQAGIIRGALHVAYGRPLELKTFFAFDNLAPVLVVSLLLGLASAILGGITCGLGSIVVSFFGTFALHFVLDKQLSPVEAIKASVSLVNRNIATVIVLVLAAYLANLIGGALCVIGTLVSTPVTLLAITYVYRRLQGEPVPA